MSFPLIANERVKESVDLLISTRRIPHAIIIEGDEGAGRKTLARYLAKAAVCEADQKPCCSCRNCRLADAGTHPDIETVSLEPKKKNITVEQIRALRTTSYQAAHTADCRAFIIESSDTMNTASQNSLLKVLEEPPSNVVFILVAEAAKNLLETVVSRCVVFSLFPPSVTESVKLLKQRGYSEEDAAYILEQENGNIGKAIKRLDGDLGSAGIDAAHDFFEAINRGAALDALLSVTALEKDRAETAKFVSALKEAVSEKFKKSRSYAMVARELAEFHSVICELEPLLNTNINLSLFFTALTSKLLSVKK
ncbi:MAG: DNA polymerase III subunit delta' [Clostridia bacterium]|nr:DNA polymerase III subunit delta' [Clostridia bacterium]